MTLLQLKYISTVAKCGSFSKAAQVLYVSQPGISKMVCALEEELGITIFVRSAAGITLTAEGRELLNMGERLLTDAEHISQHFSQDLSKTHETLSVSSQHYCFAIDAMMAYQNTYQKESYTYKFLVGQGPEVIQQVVDKTTELGVLFISSRSRKHMNRVFGDNNLEFHPLFDSKPYVRVDEEKGFAVTGNSCPRGAEYGRNELQHPVRTVTSTVRIQGADLPRLPVKTDRPLAKEKIFDCMALLNTITADAPVHVGDVLAADILGTDVNIVATKTM